MILDNRNYDNWKLLREDYEIESGFPHIMKDNFFDDEYLEIIEEQAYDIFGEVHKIDIKYSGNCVMASVSFDTTIINMLKVHEFAKESCLPLEGICTSDDKIILTFCEHKEILQSC